MKHLAQSGRHGAHARTGAGFGQIDRGQSFVDHLAGKVDVGAVLEDDHHLRQAELGRGAQPLDARQVAQGLLDGEGDLLLDLLGAQGGGDGVDLHLEAVVLQGAAGFADPHAIHVRDGYHRRPG